jgi:ElaB/YqjD/DUF883 family membrane-anchored ribosome-binding protein
LEDCRTRAQALQAENQQLRDVALDLRSQNRDLVQRSVDDARKLTALEEANRHLERSVADYQDEREQYLALIDQIRSQVRTAALAPPTTAMVRQLDAFVRAHPECRLGEASGTVRIPASAVFRDGVDELTSEGGTLLDRLAEALSGPESPSLALGISGPGRDPAGDGELRLASGEAKSTGDQGPDPALALGLDRARRVRDRLVGRLGLDPTRVAVSAGAGPDLEGASEPVSRAGGGQVDASGSAVEIRVRRLVDPDPETGSGRSGP